MLVPRRSVFNLATALSLLCFGIMPHGIAAQDVDPEAAVEAGQTAWPQAWFEIFKLAPGKHEEFIRLLDLHDQAAAAAGLPPTQIFFHDYGAEWDVLLFKPVDPTGTTPEQDAAMATKSRELGIPSGPEYFIYLRSLTASHTDTKTIGPVSAAEWLSKLEATR